ncbi:uncharacterized protein RAG0_09427 [Rhynchosporium agropyri]|uniref:Retrotransposon gag domain-containing protein n=1 Tax=Rhynchosporium agropyri TaxID=914238 RepID=A0A1E1KVG0_9HELO|nr:uncharacterized protein RAG0_09427 [Rhynchosporium agropyri]
MYLAFNRNKFEADSLKIEPALSNYLVNRHPTGACSTAITEKSQVIFRTVASFTTAIKGVFRDPNKKEQAEKHLLGIRQRGSVHEYTTEFHRYSIRLD